MFRNKKILTPPLFSALCTAAPLHAFPVFILGRALQGLSVSGINVSTRVIMADKVTLKENAKNNSIFALFAGISYAVGPLIGGFLANGNWRWCFAINLPVAAVGKSQLLRLFPLGFGVWCIAQQPPGTLYPRKYLKEVF
jgi:MFS family permease